MNCDVTGYGTHDLRVYSHATCHMPQVPSLTKAHVCTIDAMSITAMRLDVIGQIKSIGHVHMHDKNIVNPLRSTLSSDPFKLQTEDVSLRSSPRHGINAKQ